MKTLTLLLYALLMSATGSSAAQTLNQPMSAEFDPARNRVLIANTGDGNILARAADGTLSVFTDAPQAPWVTRILGNVLYVGDRRKLLGYDLDTAAPVLDLDLGGDGTAVAGITSNGVDTLWLTDFGGKRLIRVNVADPANPVWTVLQTLNGATPYGVVFDAAGNRLLIATWGSSILSYDIAADTAPQPLINTVDLNLVGVTLDCAGSLYVSAHACAPGPGPVIIRSCLKRYDPPFNLTSRGSGGPWGNAAGNIDFSRRNGQIVAALGNSIGFAQTSCLFSDGFQR